MTIPLRTPITGIAGRMMGPPALRAVIAATTPAFLGACGGGGDTSQKTTQPDPSPDSGSKPEGGLKPDGGEPVTPASGGSACPQLAMDLFETTGPGRVALVWVDRSSSAAVVRFKRGSLGSLPTPDEGQAVYTSDPSETLLCGMQSAIGLSTGWAEVCFQRKDNGIYCLRTNEKGTPRDIPFELKMVVSSADPGAVMRVQRDERFALAWSSEGKVGLRIFSRFGFPDSPVISVGSGKRPSLSMSGSRMAVAWQDGPDVRLALYDYEGKLIPPPAGKNSLAGPGANPSVSLNARGMVALSFTKTGANAPTIQVYDPDRNLLREISTRDSLTPTEILNNPSTFLDDRGHIRVTSARPSDGAIYHFKWDNFWKGLAGMSPDKKLTGLKFPSADGLTPYSLATNLIGGAFAVEGKNAEETPQIVIESLGKLPSTSVLYDTPKIGLDQKTIYFKSVPVGKTAELKFTVENQGVPDLTLTVDGLTGSSFTASPSKLTAGAFAKKEITVTFAPTKVGAVAATMVLRTNDPGAPSIDVPLYGHGATE